MEALEVAIEVEEDLELKAFLKVARSVLKGDNPKRMEAVLKAYALDEIPRDRNR